MVPQLVERYSGHAAVEDSREQRVGAVLPEGYGYEPSDGWQRIEKCQSITSGIDISPVEGVSEEVSNRLKELGVRLILSKINAMSRTFHIFSDPGIHYQIKSLKISSPLADRV